MKHIDLSDKRPKRKIVAENRRLHGEVIMLRCAVQVGAMILQVVESQAKAQAPFAQGGIVLPPVGGMVVRISEGPSDFILPKEQAEKLSEQIGQGIAAILPDHEANQKKEIR